MFFNITILHLCFPILSIKLNPIDVVESFLPVVNAINSKGIAIRV